MRVFNLAEELEKERKKNKELEERRKKDNYLIGGLSRENKEQQDIIINLVKRIDKAIYYIELDMYGTALDILKGSDNNEN